MECTECNSKMEQIDTTYANFDSVRVKKGTHTGDIFECIECGILILDNLIDGTTEKWTY